MLRGALDKDYPDLDPNPGDYKPELELPDDYDDVSISDTDTSV